MHCVPFPYIANVVGACLCATLVALAGCGGSTDEAEAAETRSAAPTRSAAVQAPSDVWPTLIDDEGRPSAALPKAHPADPAARTRSGRYALRAQAIALERALGGDALWLAADCCGSHAVDVVVGVGHALVATDGLHRDAPVFVTGRDLRVAAVVADRFEAEGMRRVFLVTDASRPEQR